jgi:hypothetical protein
MYLGGRRALLGGEIVHTREPFTREVAMRAHINKLAAAIRLPRRRAIRAPRRQLPRRSRTTFVAVDRDPAIAY